MKRSMFLLAMVFAFAGGSSFAQEAEEPVASNTVVESSASDVVAEAAE